jgi:xanthine dehydrogenase YagS FAD-binding subunit
MKQFALIAPSGIASASRLLADRDHVALAGGIDLLDRMKQGIDAPGNLVNLKALNGRDEIRPDATGGIRIGALVKLHAIATDAAIREHYTALAEAAGEAATPQVRNLATAGGNLLQRPRCWYYRNPDVPCLKKGGTRCYAVGGLNRYHAILGGGPSFIVHPSNLAPALIAFGARVELQGPAGVREVALEHFFVLPKIDPRRENVLEPGEILTEIILPATASGTHSVYFEAREKQSFDWPLASASVVIVRGDTGIVREPRIVLGAVAPIPWRSMEAERAISGRRIDARVAAHAADAALKPAAPLSDNAYKVPIAKALIQRALLRASGIAEEV